MKNNMRPTPIGLIVIIIFLSLQIAGRLVPQEQELLIPLGDSVLAAEATPSPVPTREPSPEPTKEPTPTPAPKNYLLVKVSHYWPPLGGTNCFNYINGECRSRMANGERWQEWVGIAIACPPELDFGTKLKIGDRVWTCKDVGGAIKKEGELYWVDMLTPEQLYDYGEVVKAEILE